MVESFTGRNDDRLPERASAGFLAGHRAISGVCGRVSVRTDTSASRASFACAVGGHSQSESQHDRGQGSHPATTTVQKDSGGKGVHGPRDQYDGECPKSQDHRLRSYALRILEADPVVLANGRRPSP